MKKLAILFLLIAFNASAFEVTPGLSGAWYNPDQDGHGINLIVLDDKKAVIYWYTYDLSGNQVWLAAVGDIRGNRIEARAYRYTGMRYGDFNPEDRKEDYWGKLILHFTGCYELNFQAYPDYPGNTYAIGLSASMMVKLASVKSSYCESASFEGNYHISLRFNRSTYSGVAHVFPNPDGGVQLYALQFYDGRGGVYMLSFQMDWLDTGFSGDVQYYAFGAEVNNGIQSPAYIGAGITFTGNTFEITTEQGTIYGTRIADSSFPSLQKQLHTQEFYVRDVQSELRGLVTIHPNSDVLADFGAECKLHGTLTKTEPESNRLHITFAASTFLTTPPCSTEIGETNLKVSFDAETKLVASYGPDGEVHFMGKNSKSLPVIWIGQTD